MLQARQERWRKKKEEAEAERKIKERQKQYIRALRLSKKTPTEEQVTSFELPSAL